MRELPTLGKLENVAVRDAFPHEALDLTPWLAANLDRIGEALRLELELTDTEVSVDGFAADLLAHDVLGDRVVLIENQLEKSDHTHLGQIMTYLAGLDASVMIWISPKFREPHLAAIRWLNENTIEPFAFFAVSLRTVRIGESEIAPLFEVIERPNEWEREVQQLVRSNVALSELGQGRLAFWEHVAARRPELNIDPKATSSVWVPLVTGCYLVLFKSADRVGLFLRGDRGETGSGFMERLRPELPRLAEKIGVPVSDLANSHALYLDTNDRMNWDQAGDWLSEETSKYKEAFSDKFLHNWLEAAE